MEAQKKVTTNPTWAAPTGGKRDYPNEERLGHCGCESCGSYDNLSVWSGHVHCYSPGCGYHEVFTTPNRLEYFKERLVKHNNPATQRSNTPVTGYAPRSTFRGVSADTQEVYGVTNLYDDNGEVVRQYYPYYIDGLHVATKTRYTEQKGFSWSGTDMAGSDLFGAHVVPQGGKHLVIVEGELDAMSVYEMTGYGAVSVKSASSAIYDCKRHHKYIDSFETIVLAFDNDINREDGTNPGKEAAEAVAKMFKPGKVKIMKFGTKYKDANDFLVNGEKDLWQRCFWRAETFSVNGILAGNSLWDMLSTKQTYDSVPYPFDGLNRKLYGLRTHELVTFTAGTGMGKTTLLKYISYHLSKLIPRGANIGMMMLEESTRESGLGLMSVSAKIPFHLPDAKYGMEELKKAYEDTFGAEKFFFHQNEHFDSSTITGILNQIRTFVNAYDCKYIILDHISIVVSDQENGDERRALDELMTKLKRLTMELGVCIIVVSHLRRVSGTSAEEGGQVTLQDLRGTNAIAQLSNIVIALERNSQSEDPHEAKRTRLRVLKNRFCGRLGIACEVEFDDNTNDYKELKPEDMATEAGPKNPKFTEPFKG